MAKMSQFYDILEVISSPHSSGEAAHLKVIGFNYQEGRKSTGDKRNRASFFGSLESLSLHGGGPQNRENEMDLRADYACGTSSVLLKGKAGEETAFLISRYWILLNLCSI